jgi:hypothetical protein
MYQYCTLAEAKRELKANSAIDDQTLRQHIIDVTARIDTLIGNTKPTRPLFLPYTEQRKYPVNADTVSSSYNTFWFRDFLLSVTEVLCHTTDITSQAELYPPLRTPYTALSLPLSTNWYRYRDSENSQTYVSITGVWGYHPDYANAWKNADAVKNVGGINTTTTSITVVDADGTDYLGFTPRFSVGDIIRVGSEMMLVVATNTTTNVLTVIRAVLGTTASTHAENAVIQTYQVYDVIRRICARQAGALYARQGSYQVQTLDGVGVITTPQDLLIELTHVIRDMAYVKGI